MAAAPQRFRARQELHRSHRTVVELGEHDGHQVVVKRSTEATTAAALRRAEREGKLLRLAACEHVVACLAAPDSARDPSAAPDAAQQQSLEHPYLVLEHLDGVTLSELRHPLTLERFYRVAIDACRALTAVHDAHIIHKDVNPSNFVLTRDGTTKLIDFDIATRCAREDQAFRAPAQIEGTLQYMAPEQTGRTNRPLDQRADLYSLGATFYFLLAGHAPFEEVDPVALVHRHLAEAPPPLPEGTAPLARIVLKLLAKNAEDRYQSARGVERDLVRARSGKLDALGSDDVPYRLTLPARMLGRERQARELCSVFDAMLSDGRCRVALVGGYSGVGKTSLVREVHRPLAARAGYFLQGKADPFDRTTPYAALASALEGHVRMLLGEPPAQQSALRQRLTAAFGERAATLVRGFPMLAPLLGHGEEGGQAPATGHSDPQAIERLLQRLVSVLASRRHPLVLFLDDLQWADAATLGFIERTARVGRFIVIVGAYRDNEVGGGHPLRELVARLGGALGAHLTLAPLDQHAVLEFVAETLHRPAAAVSALAKTLHARTGGNPFFLGQTLLELEHEGVLQLRGGAWTWDSTRVSALAPSSQVADITAQRMAKTPTEIRELLHIAACMGSAIDVELLVAVARREQREVEAALERALLDGFLTQLEPQRLAFLHDRVRLAAYEQHDDAHRRALHERIAAALLAHPEGRQRRLFETVSHLKTALDPKRPAGALHAGLIELGLIAAQRARSAGAFDAAAGYAQTCCELLVALDRRGGDAYLTATSLFGDAQYSLGNLDAAHDAYDELLTLETDPIRRSAVYRQKALAKTVEGQLAEAYGFFIPLVRELGFDFNTLPTADEASGMVQWARDTLVEFGLDELQGLPRNDESTSAVLIDACLYFGSIAYAFRPESFKAVQSYTLIHCFDWGVPPSAPPMITAWAYCAASVRDYALALDVARAGVRLAERLSPPAIADRARTLYAILALHYEASVDTQLIELRACADRCAAHGDLEYAGHARTAHDVLLALTQGAGAGIAERIESSRAWASELHVTACLRTAMRIEVHIAALRGTELDGVATGPDIERRFQDEALAAARDGALRVMHAVIISDYALAAEQYGRLREQRAQLEGSFAFTLVTFYGAVALSMQSRGGPPDPEARAHLDEARELLSLHARTCPLASDVLRRLVETLEDPSTQPELVAAAFDSVIEAAHVARLPLIAALAAALATHRCFELGARRIAHSFAEQACREHADLGTFAAVRALQSRYAELGLRPSVHAPFEVQGTTTGIDPRSLDLWAALRASQALAAELHIEPLISRLLGLAREAAGAQRAVLIARTSGAERSLSVVAELQGDEQLSVREPLATTERVPLPLIDRALRAGDAHVVHDAPRDPEWADLPYFRQSDVRSALCVPIVHGQQAVGALYLENALTAGAFDAGRVEVLRILASQAAVSLQNARLLLEEAEKERLRRELETAAHIQRSLVPGAPQIAGFEVAVQMTPADQVGGDYYDALHVGGRDWFVIGDVCGHGLPAGLVMIICQTALHAVLEGQPNVDPARALAQVNRLLKASLERFQESKYVAITLFHHLGDGLLEYAGLHEDLLVYRQATGEVEVEPTAGTWLGIVPDILPLIPLRRLKLAPGDVLALYTDGAIDVRGADGSLLGREGLQRMLRDCGGLPVATIRDRIVSALSTHRQTDDITLLLLRRTAD